MSPLSEAGEMTFSDNDSDSGRSGSGSLSGRPSLSSRGSQHGAIGSNRPSSRQNSLEMKSVVSVDSTFTTESVSGDESNVGAIFKNGGKKPETADAQKKAPMLVLTSAEKRKSSIF
ncbi:transcription initiation factor iif subunit alpha protein [Rutstroemia sp. NJR-2017a BBW]|nr:transcription initiation factor iif subunit alpha protein [Rutstroemia sp. NJR-2017a BBW]